MLVVLSDWGMVAEEAEVVVVGGGGEVVVVEVVVEWSLVGAVFLLIKGKGM